MAIAKLKPDVPVAPPPVTPETKKEHYKGIVADHKTEPLQQFLPYIDGIPWTVRAWYGQLLGEHNELRELDTGETGAYQQYQKVIALELRVTSGLASSYDGATGMTSVTGSANMHTVIPNEHDYFVADAGNRNYGIYRVTKVDRKTFNRSSVYSIDYVLVGYAENNPTLVTLESKVVRKYRFSKDRLVEGLAPLIREDRYAVIEDLRESVKTLEDYYFYAFMNPRHNTLVLPGQDQGIYDAFLVDFVLQFADISNIPGMLNFKRVSIDRDHYLTRRQFWGVLADRNLEFLPYIPGKVGLVSRTHFNKNSWIKSAAYWNIDRFVYPVVEEDPVALLRNIPATTVTGEEIVQTSPYPQRTSIFTDLEIDYDDSEIPLIKPVLIDDYYVLSGWFYAGEGEPSALEILVKDYLQCNTLDIKVLQALRKSYLSWAVLEQFYYGPLLMLLCREAVKGFYEDINP